MSRFRRKIATSNHPLIKAAKRAYHGIDRVSLPIPIVAVRPVVRVARFLGVGVRFLRRTLIAEPYFKSMCRSYGKHLHTGIHLHYFTGKGSVVLGDDVFFDGKSTFAFASRFVDSPTLEVGDRTEFGNHCAFTIGKRITVGSHCMIASGVWLFDSNGHQVDPAARKLGLPPLDEEVRPIRIGDNVWVGRNSTIYPGVTIGDGSIVSTGSVVVGDVPPYTVVAGNPARKIALLKSPEAPANPGQPEGGPAAGRDAAVVAGASTNSRES